MVGEAEWNENSSNHSATLNFKVADVEQRYLERLDIQPGDKIQLLYNNEVKYIFVVLKINREYPYRTVECSDFAFYLENNEVVIQFNNVSVDKALAQLFKKIGVKYNICSMPATVNEVYIDDCESIIEELLEIQRLSDGIERSYRVDRDTVVVYELPTVAENYRFKPAYNVAEYDVTLAHTPCKYSKDISDVKNSITAVIESRVDGNLPAIEYTIEDKDSINSFGKLNKNLTLSTDKQFEIEIDAKNELEALVEPEIEVSCEMTGAINAQVDKIMRIVDEFTGINENMRIKEVTHSFNNGIWTMSVSLKRLAKYILNNVVESKIQREQINANGTFDYDTYYDTIEETDEIDNRKEAMIEEGLKYLGTPYVWGGSTPDGFDCSGFVCYLMEKYGFLTTGRTTAQGLFDTLNKVKSPKKGDLIFWVGTNPNSKNLITHVGICIGNGKNIQASSTEGVIIAKNTGAYAYGRYGYKEG